MQVRYLNTTGYGHSELLVVGRKGAEQREFSIQKGIRYHCVFHYYVKGAADVEISNRKYRISPGDGFFTFPNQQFSYRAGKTGAFEFYWIAFCGESVENILSQATITRNTSILRGDINEKWINRFDRMIEILKERPKAFFLKGNLLLNEWLIELIEMNNNKKTLPYPKESWKESVISFMLQHYSDGITVQELADIFGFERAYFSTRFHREAGMTVSDVLTTIRYDNARELLKNTNLPINSIAKQIGFSNHRVFCRWFKKMADRSPSDFRK